jgi:hypothetical protein
MTGFVKLALRHGIEDELSYSDRPESIKKLTEHSKNFVLCEEFETNVHDDPFHYEEAGYYPASDLLAASFRSSRGFGAKNVKNEAARN